MPVQSKIAGRMLYIGPRRDKLADRSIEQSVANSVCRFQNEAVVYGTIKKIIKDKGFGFIVPDDGMDEVFFHRSKLAAKVRFEDLREGDEVQFDPRPGDKGRQAFNLRMR